MELMKIYLFLGIFSGRQWNGLKVGWNTACSVTFVPSVHKGPCDTHNSVSSYCTQEVFKNLFHPPSAIRCFFKAWKMCWWLKGKQTACDHFQFIHSTCKSVLDFLKQRITVFCFRCSFLTPVLEHRVLSLVLGSTLQERHLSVRAGLKEDSEERWSESWSISAMTTGWGSWLEFSSL